MSEAVAPAAAGDARTAAGSAPVRVLYVHHVGAIGGAERSLLLLLARLARSRFTPLFAGPGAGGFPDALRAQGVPVFPLAFGRLRHVGRVVRSTVALAALARRLRVDLLHANGPQTNLCASLAGRLAGVPAVWHARNMLYPGMVDVDRALAPLAAAIICNSDAIRERFRGSRGWARAVTVRNAIDLDEFSPAVSGDRVRRELDLPADVPVVGIVGRIGADKGQDWFVRAAADLVAAGSPARFLVVGAPSVDADRPYAEALVARVRAEGLADRIRFLGFRRDVPEVMAALDVLVLASDAEGCGRVLFEAMATATPVVATDTGGTPEIVRDGVDGLLVPPRDAGRLRAAIARLLDDPALRRAFADRAAARARAEFGVDAHVAATVATYERVLAARRRPRRRPAS